jgi:hypothetical protein
MKSLHFLPQLSLLAGQSELGFLRRRWILILAALSLQNQQPFEPAILPTGLNKSCVFLVRCCAEHGHRVLQTPVQIKPLYGYMMEEGILENYILIRGNAGSL